MNWSVFRGAEFYEPSEEELDVYAEFSDALVQGRNPSVAEYTVRYPHLAPRLRPLLESAAWFQAEMNAFKARYPGLRGWHLLVPPAQGS
jgi:hypothetical protein